MKFVVLKFSNSNDQKSILHPIAKTKQNKKTSLGNIQRDFNIYINFESKKR